MPFDVLLQDGIIIHPFTEVLKAAEMMEKSHRHPVYRLVFQEVLKSFPFGHKNTPFRWLIWEKRIDILLKTRVS